MVFIFMLKNIKRHMLLLWRILLFLCIWSVSILHLTFDNWDVILFYFLKPEIRKVMSINYHFYDHNIWLGYTRISFFDMPMYIVPVRTKCYIEIKEFYWIVSILFGISEFISSLKHKTFYSSQNVVASFKSFWSQLFFI